MTRDDDLTFKLQNTWIEDADDGFGCVASVEYLCDNRIDMLFETTMGEFREQVKQKLKKELGLTHHEDYIFEGYEDDWWDFVHNSHRTQSFHQFVLKFREQQHFVMFKLHYYQ